MFSFAIIKGANLFYIILYINAYIMHYYACDIDFNVFF